MKNILFSIYILLFIWNIKKTKQNKMVFQWHPWCQQNRLSTWDGLLTCRILPDLPNRAQILSGTRAPQSSVRDACPSLLSELLSALASSVFELER